MTTSTLPATTQAPSALTRILNVSRLHFVNKGQIVVVPWMIMSFIFILSLLIGLIVRASFSSQTLAEGEGTIEYGGAAGFFLIYMLVIAVMSISQTFPFAQSYSVTRRDFYLGTILAFGILTVLYSLAITLLGWIEDLTGGWGLNVNLFSPEYLSPNLAERLYVTLVLFLFFFMMGMATASVYVRWKSNGMLVFFGAITLLILGLAALATFTSSWPAVGAWFDTMGLLGIVTWTLVPTALAAITGFLLLRRAIPRN